MPLHQRPLALTPPASPQEWVHRYLRLSPRLRRGYRRFVDMLPDGPQRLQDLDEKISQWPADIADREG